MRWCNPCALVWVVTLSAYATHLWLNVNWQYCIAAVVVLIPAIAVFLHEERDGVHDAAQSIVADVWWLFKGWKKQTPKYVASEARQASEN